MGKQALETFTIHIITPPITVAPIHLDLCLPSATIHCITRL